MLKNVSAQLTASRLIISVAILLSWALTVMGFWEPRDWLAFFPFMDRLSQITSYLLFLSVCTLLIVLGARFTDKRFLTIFIVLAVLISVLAGGFFELLAILLYALASLVLGSVVFRLLNIAEDTASHIQMLLMGTGIFASLVSVGAHFPINYSWVYFLALWMPVILKRHWLFSFLRGRVDFLLQRPDSMCFADWPKVALGILCLLYFTFAFLPELSHDGLAMHLFVPAHVASRHEWGFDPGLYSWALMPMLGDWNYSIGYLIAGETGARLINIGYIFALTCLVRELVLWAKGNEESALWAMLLFLSTPLAFLEASSLFIESVWASYLLAGFLLLLRVSTNQERFDSGVVLAAIMVGFSIATKVLSLFYFPALVLLLLFCFRKTTLLTLKKSSFKAILYFTTVGFIPYLVAYYKTGNPVFPFYNAYFQSDFYPHINFDNNLFKAGITWDLPYKIVFFSEKYIESRLGSPGFQWIMLLMPSVAIACLLKSKRLIVLFLVGLLSLTALFHVQSYLRYALPVIVILNVLIGVSITQISSFGQFFKKIIILSVFITLILNLIFFGSWPYRDIPVMKAFHQDGYEQLIVDRAPVRKAIALINTLNHGNAPVAFLCASMGAGLRADALYDSWYNYNFSRLLEKANTPSLMSDVFKKYHASYVILDSKWSTQYNRENVERVTNLIAQFGSISVRSIKDETQ